jgi:hypothetical protein
MSTIVDRTCYFYRSLNTIAGILTRLRAGRLRFKSRQGKETSLNRPYRFRTHTASYLMRIRVIFWVKGVRGVRLTTPVHPVPMLITNSAVSIPSMPAWLGKGQIYLYLYSDMLSIVLQTLPVVQRFQKTRCGFPRFKIIPSLGVLRLRQELLHTGMVHNKAFISTGQIIFRQLPGHHNLNEDTWKK